MDISGQGDSVEEARKNLIEAIELFFEMVKFPRNSSKNVIRNLCNSQPAKLITPVQAIADRTHDIFGLRSLGSACPTNSSQIMLSLTS